MVSKLQDIAEDYPQINIIAATFDNENQSESLLSEIANRIDIVVFSGPVPYMLAKDLVDQLNVPFFYVPYDELAILTMLMSLSVQEQKKLERFSIDVPDKRHVVEVFNEIRLPMNQVYMIDYEQEFDGDQLFEFHRDLYASGKIEYAVTSRFNVHRKLLKHGVPCYRLIPPHKSMRDVIDLVNLKCEALLLNVARFVVINIGKNKHNTQWITEDDEEINLRLYQDLTGFAKMLGGSITHKQGFISIYTDRKKLDHFTNDLTQFPFFEELKNDFTIDLSVGIGFGWSNHDAEKHAMIALQEASSQRGDHIYVVTENKEVKAPVYTPNRYLLKTDNKNLLKIADETNLSITTISKIKTFWDMTEKNSIHSEELANGLEITRRSAQRILRILADCNFAKIIGEEQPYKKGRPIPLYQILLETAEEKP
ncbi:hypothetical protein VN24_22130 [Paenibacillus beijingensis]|uniref:Transcriptional regulator n=2 Tax=Paenibacillus beijingensis TaxID=1126833 RepID=A0A0D5NNC6_9BACL|nr:hypothetical protein VN24_22130 [Paenibacillus beijingensis]